LLKITSALATLFAFVALLALPGTGQTKTQTPSKKAAPKKGSSKKTPSKTSSKKSAKKAAPKQAAAGSNSLRFRRTTQQQPTPERYMEIQQALVDRGYIAGPPDGKWGTDDVEALKRFQREQSLSDDGKIGALTLIALGLGPRRVPLDTASTAESNPRPE
jgi:peptidoglycan hydrolase-like protein with peptidoglycan-binding domain